MKINENDKKEKMTAIQFMKTYDDTLKIIESIGNKTVEEQKTLTESANTTDHTNEEGVFEMGNLLDVDIPTNDDMNQPRYYNSPMDDLTDGDKSVIVDEFTNMLKNMHEEVIDFSDIGPVATVIQNKLGYKQNLEDFLGELINSAVDKQDSQAFAHGDQPVPGLKGRTDDMAEEGGPADIEPTQVSPEGAAPMDEMPMDGTDVDVSVELSPDMDMAPEGDVPPVDDMALEGDVPPVDDVVEPVDDMAPEGDVPPVDDMAPEGDVPPVDDMAPEGDDVVPEVGEDDGVVPEVGEDDDVVPEVGEDDGVVPEVGEEDDDDDDDDDEKKPVIEAEGEKKSLDAQLESIKVEYEEKLKEKSVDAQLEAIKDGLLKKEEPEAKVEATEGEKEPEAKVEAAEGEKEPEAKAKVEASETDDSKSQKDVDDKVKANLEAIIDEKKAIDAKLESISKGYHDGENAKMEAKKTEKKLDATLESISKGYHDSEKAKVEAVVAEKKLDENLNTLVENYHKGNKKAKVENVEQRKKTREKIEELTKE